MTSIRAPEPSLPAEGLFLYLQMAIVWGGLLFGLSSLLLAIHGVISSRKKSCPPSLVALAWLVMVFGVVFLSSFFLEILVPRTEDRLSNEVSSFLPSQESLDTIIALSVDASTCNAIAETTRGKSQIPTGFDIGYDAQSLPSCGIPKHQLSESRQFAAIQTLSGGIDSQLKIYSAPQDVTIILDVYGTSTIFDFIFLPGDILAVMQGYPDIFDEQYFRIYDIAAIFEEYPATIDPQFQYLNDASKQKLVDLPDHIEAVNNFNLNGDSLEIRGDSKKGNMLLASFPLTELADFSFSINQQQAVSLVRERPEVKDFLDNIEHANVYYSHEDPERNAWVIHVVENLSDHTATFNWYEVDKVTGSVRAQF